PRPALPVEEVRRAAGEAVVEVDHEGQLTLLAFARERAVEVRGEPLGHVVAVITEALVEADQRPAADALRECWPRPLEQRRRQRHGVDYDAGVVAVSLRHHGAERGRDRGVAEADGVSGVDQTPALLVRCEITDNPYQILDQVFAMHRHLLAGRQGWLRL